MPAYRHHLPQLGREPFLTDGGLETTLVFHQGLDLPYFAAFDLLGHSAGETLLHQYFRRYLEIAARHRCGFILESATWRANPDWASRLGYNLAALDRANRRAIAMFARLRQEFRHRTGPLVISGCLGPRGDGYVPGEGLDVDAARSYHSVQIGTFVETAADLVTAITMTHVEEALGIALAARDRDMPIAISFTVETDGRLPSGQPLADAIEVVDRGSDRWPAYYMINCAHPTHFAHVFEEDGPWERIRGVRGNASCLSHAELDAATTLDDGDPVDLARRYADLRRLVPEITVFGGCCGTDHRHLDEIARSCIEAEACPC